MPKSKTKQIDHKELEALLSSHTMECIGQIQSAIQHFDELLLMGKTYLGIEWSNEGFVEDAGRCMQDATDVLTRFYIDRYAPDRL